jgi:predicted nucleic acid-binding protein
MNQMIIVILALIAQAGAWHNTSNCTDEFHETLKKAVEIKNHCNIRGFYDCCQVTICEEYGVEPKI